MSIKKAYEVSIIDQDVFNSPGWNEPFRNTIGGPYSCGLLETKDKALEEIVGMFHDELTNDELPKPFATGTGLDGPWEAYQINYPNLITENNITMQFCRIAMITERDII